MTLIKHSLKPIFGEIFQFLISNFFLVFVIGLFVYRTFLVGNLNWALLLFVASLFVIIVCRTISYYRPAFTNTLGYWALVLLTLGLLVGAFATQTLRFVHVFSPGLAKLTLPVLLVRISVVTVTFYAYALLITLGCYLYVSQIFEALWDASPEKVSYTPLTAKERQHLKQVRFFAGIFIRTLVWGGTASIITVAVGFISWLLRDTHF